MELTKLGNPDATADRRLEAFPIADRTQVITLECAEFTCRCPITGQPDWAHDHDRVSARTRGRSRPRA